MSIFLVFLQATLGQKARVLAQRPIFYCSKHVTNETDIYIYPSTWQSLFLQWTFVFSLW